MQLSSMQSNMRIKCSFVKDIVKLVYLSDIEGELSLKQPANNTVVMAKGLLERYQNYLDAPIYGKFASMLNGVELNLNQVRHDKNVKLEISGSEQNRISYTWTYVDSNEVLAEKKNIILIYENGIFKGFFNNWPLYNIVESESNFSAEQATKLAIEASRNFSYPVAFKNGTNIMVSGFSIDPESLGNAKLIYVNSVEQEFARAGDPYEMHLAWYVPLGFDRFYPGDVSGMTVILWADTGEVCGMDRVIVDSRLAESLDVQTIENKETVIQSSLNLSTQAIGISAVAGLFLVLFGTSKIFSTGKRKRTGKFLGVLLCISVVSMTFTSLPSVSAISPTGRSRVYSSVGTDDGYSNFDADECEELATAELCNYVGNASIDAGYVTSNSYSNTINTVVASNAGNDEQDYKGTMLFHAGHFSEENEAYQDSSGDPINYNSIYTQTSSLRHFFVFLWVCVQAEDPTDGTTVGWTHRDGNPSRPYMADVYDKELGYTGSDGRGQCYISFYGFSPMLSSYVNQSGGYFYNFAEIASPGNCSWFAIKFYYYALIEGYSVRDSLDIASGEFFGCDYEQTVLNTGYHSWWPGGNWGESPLSDQGYYPRDFNEALSQPPWNQTPRDPNRMRVFGAANIKLYQPQITLSANYGLSPTFTIDYQSHNTGSYRVLPITHRISVNEPQGYDFLRFSYDGQNYYNNPSDIEIDSDGQLTAYFDTETPILTVLSGGPGGALSLTFGDHEYDYGETAYVSVIGEHLGYDFSHWHLDGYDAGTSTTKGISMYADHTVQPQWTQVQYIVVEDVLGGHTNHDGYTQGTGTMAITAIPDSGWHIEEWLVNDEHYADGDQTIYVDYEYGGAWVEPLFEQDAPAYTHVYFTAYEEIYQNSVDAGILIDDEYWDSTGYGTIDCYILAGTTHSFEAEAILGGGESIWWSEIDDGFYDYGGYIEWYCEEGDLYITFVYCLAK